MNWISVKDDGLPEYDKDYLFVNGRNEVSVGRRFPCHEGVAIYTSETRDSIYFNDIILEEWATCKYWMPLPKPPKENCDE